MPFNQNINWVAAGAAVTTLFAYFFPGLPENVRSAILTLALVGLIIVVPYLHTFVNHPANKDAAAALADKAVAAVKGKSAVFSFLLVPVLMLGLTLGGCTAAGSFFSNPQNDLQVAEAGFSTALALYNSICEQNTNLAICSPADVQEAATLEKAVTDAIQAASALLGAEQSAAAGTGPTEDQISASISAVTNAVTNFNNFVNQLQVKKASALALAHH